MRFATIVLTAAVSCAAIAPAVAGPTRLSDTQFIAANRCLGLLSSKSLGTQDAAAMRQLIKDQSWGRDSFVYDKADEARDTGLRDASRGGAEGNLNLTAERDGVCHSFVASQTTAAGPAPSRNLQ
jgi:hypothetical protein